MAKPLVSCVMVTGHQERRSLAMLAIASFRRQTYGNRELVIVNEGEPFYVADERVREVAVSPGKKLGELRNVGLLAASGDLVMQWDDDDWHGCRRIANQVEHGWPNILANEIVLNCLTGEARVVSAKRWRQGGFPGTILHPRSTHVRYKPMAKSEDTVFASRFPDLRPLDNSPLDYVRRYHGANTWHEEHFASFMATGRPLTQAEEHLLYGIDWLHKNQGLVPLAPCKDISQVKQVLGELKWMNWTSAKFVAGLIAEHGVKTVLEIGHLHGVSTCYLACTGAHVTTVDLPSSAANVPNVEDTLRACGLSAHIVREPSRDAMAQWVLAGKKYDLLLVDGGHGLADALIDLLLGDRLLNPGGWLIFDDVANEDYPQVARAWSQLPAHYERHSCPNPNWGVARKALAA